MEYRIGEFAKVVDIPVSTLRYYDNVDILKPEYVDPYSGYRYYTENNKSKALEIKQLQYLKFTLEEIKQYEAGLTAETIDFKIEQLKQERSELDNVITYLEAMSPNYQVEEEKVYKKVA